MAERVSDVVLEPFVVRTTVGLMNVVRWGFVVDYAAVLAKRTFAGKWHADGRDREENGLVVNQSVRVQPGQLKRCVVSRYSFSWRGAFSSILERQWKSAEEGWWHLWEYELDRIDCS